MPLQVRSLGLVDVQWPAHAHTHFARDTYTFDTNTRGTQTCTLLVISWYKKGDGRAALAGASSAANAVDIVLNCQREREVDHHLMRMAVAGGAGGSVR